jgi:hypothetical protein
MSSVKFRIPRIWSNKELAKFSWHFKGEVANISGWKDCDKQGRNYKHYFSNAAKYWITNFKSEARGFQGNLENEIFLDLTSRLEDNHKSYDVVFNHTVLEHVFELDLAFSNLCKLSKDIVILVVPFMQEQHADYGDYWRFTPQAVDKLFIKNSMETLYINYNDTKYSSIYIFAIASKLPENWKLIKNHPDNQFSKLYSDKAFIGKKVFQPSFLWRLFGKFVHVIRNFLVKK